MLVVRAAWPRARLAASGRCDPGGGAEHRQADGAAGLLAEWSGEPENREPGKHAQVRWVRTSAIPEAFVPTTATALRDYLTGGPDLSLDGWK
jgi:hypothetical protein